jgi:hypothetical protein
MSAILVSPVFLRDKWVFLRSVFLIAVIISYEFIRQIRYKLEYLEC